MVVVVYFRSIAQQQHTIKIPSTHTEIHIKYGRLCPKYVRRTARPIEFGESRLWRSNRNRSLV